MAEPISSWALAGTVERVVFHNPDSGWCVIRVKIKGRRRLASVVGHSLFIVPGETIEAEGEWTEHPEHGERFLARVMRTTLPRGANAALKYLSSGLVSGVGEELAQRLVKAFSADVFDVMEKSPERLLEVEGIGAKRAESIRKSWDEQKILRGIMEFLHTHGMSATKAPRIYRAFGSQALETIEKNPYRLAREVPGVGFKSADLIARHLQLPLEDDERFASALHDRLSHAIARGHCGYPEDRLLKEAAIEVGYPPAMLESALDAEIDSGRLTEERLGKEKRLCVFPSALATAERRLAYTLSVLAQGEPPWGPSAVFLDAPPAVSKAPLKNQPRLIKLSDEQRLALKTILSSKVSVLTGGPGTGKTTLIRSVQSELALRGWNVVCCAPTGRAAQRLFEATGVEARTIHRLLGWEGGEFRHGHENPLHVDLLIADEASMIGLELMEALVAALPPQACLLLVGDADQLPSVQAGRVLESILDAQTFSHIHLSEIFRQANGRESLISRVALEVLQGQMPHLVTKTPDQEFHFIEARSPEHCRDMIVRLVKERIPERFGLDPLNDIQVLCPMNKGLLGARELNRALQAALNPNPADKLERFGQTIASGDKVIVTANDYNKDVFNGDIGRCLHIERERSVLRVGFSAGGSATGAAAGLERRVDFAFTDLDSLALAFAITVHKAQGSEYDAVVIPVLDESAAILGRSLLYTAITRGKKLVVMVGSSQALHRALRSGDHLEKRWSALDRRLSEAMRLKAHSPFGAGVPTGWGVELGAARGGAMNAGSPKKT